MDNGSDVYIDAGKVSIGTNAPESGFDLTVCGKIKATEVEVETGWCDYVFAEDYDLMSLHDVEKHIKRYQRLPDMPSEKEVLEDGLSLGEIMVLQQKKIEELYLYIIELEKEITKLKSIKADN